MYLTTFWWRYRVWLMKYIVATFVALFLLSTTVVFAAPPPWAGTPGGPNGGGDETPPETPIIIVDPGHGGSLPGTTQCPGLTEAAANLDIALRLEGILETNDTYDVRLTRTGNFTKSNNDRYTFANEQGGHALVSIHLNGSTDHSVNGTQGFYGKKNKDEAFTRVVHEVLANNPEFNLGVLDRGVTNFPSGVLLKSKMPSTLQEAVFISNKLECTKLKDPTGFRQQEIAEALAAGVKIWFE